MTHLPCKDYALALAKPTLDALARYGDNISLCVPYNYRQVFVYHTPTGYTVFDRYAFVEGLTRVDALDQIVTFLLNPPPNPSIHVEGGEWVET